MLDALVHFEYDSVASRNHTSDECTASPVGGASDGSDTANGTVTGVLARNAIPLPSLTDGPDLVPPAIAGVCSNGWEIRRWPQ